MKINSNAIAALTAKIQNGKCQGVLFFGPDSGVAELGFKHMLKMLGNYGAEQLAYEDLVQDPQRHLMTLSLFASKPIIKVRDVAGVFDKTLKEVLEQSLVSIPCFFAGELTPSSAIRKFFETHDRYAAVACYNDDHVQVGKIIHHKISSAGKTIESDAVRFLEHHLRGDRLLVVSELDKLIAYTANDMVITLPIAEAIISKSVTSSADMMCIHFALSELQAFEEEVNKLLKDMVSPIWIIRALIRYHINLYNVLLQHEYGVPQAQAIKSLRPNIFFKYIPAFRSALERTNHAHAIAVIEALCALEVQVKRGVLQDHQAVYYLSELIIKRV